MSSKILVVEDNADTRELIHYYFTNAGFTVVTAVDGSEGLYMAKAEVPDLIITDLAMPNVDGLELIKKLRDDPETADIPILVYTAHGSTTTEEIRESGAEQIFYKPSDFEEMVKVVQQMIRKPTGE